jgi:mannose-6-phosphate isomerase-like protein (cupin superfamily)
VSGPVAINLREKLGRIDKPWNPKVCARVNDHDVRLAKIEGAFIWHKHDDEDEAFLVIDGELTMGLRTGDVTVRAGELIVIPAGVEHCPSSPDGCSVLLFEPRSVVNTGDQVGSERTIDVEWV